MEDVLFGECICGIFENQPKQKGQRDLRSSVAWRCSSFVRVITPTSQVETWEHLCDWPCVTQIAAAGLELSLSYIGAISLTFHGLHGARAWLQNWESLGVLSSFSMFLEDTGVLSVQVLLRPVGAQQRLEETLSSYWCL